MSLKNRDEHNRWRNKALRNNLANVLMELQRIENGSEVNDELLDLIKMIADILGGLKEVSE